MPELRTDWLTGRTVLIAENRAQRPNDFAGEVALATGAATAPLDADAELAPVEADELDVAGTVELDDDSGRSFFPSFSGDLATEGSFLSRRVSWSAGDAQTRRDCDEFAAETTHVEPR